MKNITPKSRKNLFCCTVYSAMLFSPTLHAIDFSLFGDSALSGGGDNTSFAVGAVDFFATHAIDEKSRAFIEYVFEAGDHGLVTDLERIWVSRDLTENITVSAGRFHTPLGYWNRTYHHGAFMQETISRPFFLDFEDGAAGVLPVHTVGIMSWGEFDLGNGTLGYEAAIANGSNINSDELGFSANESEKPEIEINDSADTNSNKSVSLRLRYSSSAPWSGSVFVNIQDVAESGEGTLSTISNGAKLVGQTILGFDLQAQMGAFDIMTEYYRFDHDSDISAGATPSDSSDTSGSAYFVQLGWRANEELKVIARRENLSFDEEDVWFGLLGAGEGSHNVLAFRYELSASNALKLEVNRSSPDEGDDETVSTLQWTFMIP